MIAGRQMRCLAGACVALLLMMRPCAAQQKPDYQIVAPEMVLQGEEFTARVVQITDKGQAPAPQGTNVFVDGIKLTTDASGKIQLPALLQVSGNQFLFFTVFAGGEQISLQHHVEVIWLPQEPGQPPQIAHTGELCPPGGNLRVEGVGLNDLRNTGLKGANTTLPLNDSVGSSLQRIYPTPADLPKGSYRFVAQDPSGRSLEAPNQTITPTLTLNGTQIRRRGQRGQFVVNSDVEGDVTLSGGEPNIKLDTRQVHVTPAKPATVGFTAQIVGNYDVKALLITPDAQPPADAPPADARVGELHVESSAGGTAVQAQVTVTDERGQPLANTPVDVALAGAQGLQCSRITTDANGRAAFKSTLPGQAPAGGLGLFCYRVAGHPWSKNKQRKQQPPRYQYAIKFVCGRPDFPVVAPGRYFTAINVHNPGEKPALVLKKIAVALPGEKAGPVSRFFLAQLRPDEALEIDCPDILRHAQLQSFLKGFVVLESEAALDVVAVYTAGHEEVETEDVVRVPPRLVQPAVIVPPELLPSQLEPKRPRNQ
jgi:hypothetical protein